MIKMGKPKTYDEIRTQCEAQGVPLNARKYLNDGWDTIMVGDPAGGHVIYNTFNGRFFGWTPVPTEEFNSDQDLWDHCPWFVALLNFFYHPARTK
jgi:hypothetical protein